MGITSKTVLAIRVFGDDLDPDEITRLLGAAPTTSYRTGEVRKVSRGRKIVAKTGSWILEAKEHLPGGFSVQVVEILSRLTPDLSVWEALCQHYRCDLYGGLFLNGDNNREDFTVQAMAMMAERNLPMGFNIYGPD